MSRTKGYKCYNIQCGSCIGKTLCGEPGDEATWCQDRVVDSWTAVDYEKLASSVKLCGSTPKVDQCRKCHYWAGGDMSKCIPRMTADCSTAITDLLARAEAAEAELIQKESYYKQMVDALAATDSFDKQKLCEEADHLKDLLKEAEARAEKAEKALRKVQSILYEPLIIEENGVLRPVKRTSKQDVYKTVLLAQKSVGITGRWFPEWMKEE